MQIFQLLLSAILSIFPHMSGNNRACIERNFDDIAMVAEAAERDMGVPPAVILAVGFLETHLGCDQGEGGNWGAPISRTRRHTAGTPAQAALALSHGYQVCHTWVGAISRFRSGQCRIPARMANYPRNAINLINRMSRVAGVPSPIPAPVVRPCRPGQRCMVAASN